MIIAVNNNKGGVTKTTTVINLAGVLALRGYKVLIVDADNQSDIALSFGINPDKLKTTIYDVLIGGVPAEEALINVYKNIDMLPSNLDLIAFDFDIIGNPQLYPEPYNIMKDALYDLQFQYDYILIDTPPALSLMNGNVFNFADKVIIPTEPELYAMRSVRAVVDTIKDFKEMYNPAIEVSAIVFTKVVKNANVHIASKQAIRSYASEQGIPVLETETSRTVEHADIVSKKELPSVLVNSKSDKSKTYVEIWNELDKILNFRKGVVK